NRKSITGVQHFNDRRFSDGSGKNKSLEPIRFFLPDLFLYMPAILSENRTPCYDHPKRQPNEVYPRQ
ncbi:MAG: hypothetical protein AB7U43_11870, partial [Desulfobacter sp.]